MMDEVNMVERERKLVGTPKVASLKSLELKKQATESYNPVLTKSIMKRSQKDYPLKRKMLQRDHFRVTLYFNIVLI